MMDQLLTLIEINRGDIEHEFGDFTTRPDFESETVELLAGAGYDWITEGEVIAVARLSSRSADARLVVTMEE